MKNKILGLTIAIISIAFVFFMWDDIANAWYLLTRPHDRVSRSGDWFLAGQWIFYTIVFTLSNVFGVLLIAGTKGGRLRTARTTFWATVLLLVILEFPVYECDALAVARHSFWNSHEIHFH